MENLVRDFTNHLREALAISITLQTPNFNKEIHNVVFTGLGGSGIGGEIVSKLVTEKVDVPVVCNHDYTLPNFANENTLVIASSYSGNTEETLEALNIALEKGCECAIVSSGGEITELAKEKGLTHITIPGGHPPRAAFGYSFVQLFTMLNAYGLISDYFIEDLEEGIEYLDDNEENIETEAQNIAQKIHGKNLMIYSSLKNEKIAIRFRQQINENSKELCCHHALPEMNHNELVGWAGGNEDYAVINFIDEKDHYKTKERFRISKEIISKYTSSIIDIPSINTSEIANALYWIHIGDWISVKLADIKNIDPVEVDVITFLKGELAKL